MNSRISRRFRPGTPLRSLLRPRPLTLALSLAFTLQLHAAPVQIDLPAQPLAESVKALARQAGLTIAADDALLAGKRAPALQGAMEPAQALRQLLKGSGLEAVQSEGTWLLRPASQPAPAAAGAHAQEVPALPKVTVLAARDPNLPLSNVPASLSFMPRERIEEEQATASRVEDLLSRGVPGFNPTNTGVRQIRGRTAQVFVNGVPTNEQLRASSGSDLNLLAPDQLDAIEVSRGANSAYGFGAAGGIIALHTPRAESEKLTLRSRLGASFNGKHAGSSLQTSLYQSAAQIVGDFDYHVGLSMRRDGLSFSPRGKPALDFNSPAMFSMGKEKIYSFDTSLGLKLGDAGSLRLAATAGYVGVEQHYESDDTGTYRVTPSNLVHRASGDRDNRHHHTLNLSYENAHLGRHALKIEVFSSRVHERRWTSDTEYLDQFNEYQGLRSSVSTPLDTLYQGASVTWGLDFIRNRYYNPQVDATTGVPTLIWGPDTAMRSLAPYVQGQLPVGDFRLSAGLRHERYRGSVETGTSTTGTGNTQGGKVQPFNLTLFNAGVVYPLARNREAYASFTQGSEVSQLSRAARSAGTASLIDPAPAKSNQYELGLRQRGQPLGYSLAVFYTESDLMSALLCAIPNEPCRPLREPREFWGIEGTLDWRIDAQWSSGGTLAWMDGMRTLEDGERRRIGSSESPPLLVGAYLEYAPTRGWKNRLQLDWRARRDPFRGSIDWPEGRVDSLLLAHFSTSVEVGPGKLQFGIRNLFDKTYYSLVSQAYNGGYLWIPEAGRRFSLSYSAEW